MYAVYADSLCVFTARMLLPSSPQHLYAVVSLWLCAHDRPHRGAQRHVYDAHSPRVHASVGPRFVEFATYSSVDAWLQSVLNVIFVVCCLVYFE